MEQKLSKKDEKFSFIFCRGYEKLYEDMYNKSLKYQINLKKENLEQEISDVEIIDSNKKKFNVQFIPIGYIEGDTFTWVENVKEAAYINVEKHKWIENGFVSKKFLDYFFQDKFIINKDCPDLITYILSLTNPTFKVLKFTSSNGVVLYAFVKLEIENDVLYIMGKAFSLAFLTPKSK